jgi:hypothetical protein
MRLPFIHQRRYLDIFGLMGLIALAVSITTAYISQEQYFYFWDYAHYSDRVSQLAAKLQASPLKALECFVDYLGDDYTQIPSLPLLPFALLFGNSRLVFILSLALVYVVSFGLSMAALATQIIIANPRLVFWSTAYLSILIPATWSSILRGYPDLGGASIMALAILLYWKDPQLKQRKQMIQIAGALALAVWFRRPFVYGVRAFLVALSIEILLTYTAHLKQDRKRMSEKSQTALHSAPLPPILGGSESLKSPRMGDLGGECRVMETSQTSSKLAFQELKRSFFQILKIGAWFIIFSPVLVFKVLFVDYSVLYASYELSVQEGLQFYAGEFGWLTCALALLGYGVGLLIQNPQYQKRRFLFVLGSLAIAQWIFLAKQNGSHYTTHFIPFIVIGLILLASTTKNALRAKPKTWIALFILGMCLTVFNMISGLTVIGDKISVFRALFPTTKSPLYRTDYEEFLRLVSFLRKKASEGQNIYVAASSETLTSDAIVAGDRQIYHQSDLNILRTSNIDSRDVYPLNALMKAHFIVVASPTQYHIRPEEQRVVKVVVDIFQQHGAFSKDFQQLPMEFALEKGVQVKVYRRIRATPLPTVLTTLQQMRDKVERQPGREPYWLSLQSEQSNTIEKDIIRTVQIRDIPLQYSQPSSFLYFGSLSPSVSIKAKLNTARCNPAGNIVLHFSALDSQGNVLATQTWHNSKREDINIIFSTLPPLVSYLRLDIQRTSQSPTELKNSECSVSVNNVVVSAAS